MSEQDMREAWSIVRNRAGAISFGLQSIAEYILGVNQYLDRNHYTPDMALGAGRFALAYMGVKDFIEEMEERYGDDE